MKSISMNKDQSNVTSTPVENGQQSDSALYDVANQLVLVQSQIKTATDRRAPRYGTEPVALVAVSKRQPGKIDAHLAAGFVFLAKTRSEASQRWTGRRMIYSDLTLHLIGPLQTIKLHRLLRFDVIEVVDQEKLARALLRK